MAAQKENSTEVGGATGGEGHPTSHPASQPVACCMPFKYVIISFMCSHTHTQKSDMSCTHTWCECVPVCFGLFLWHARNVVQTPVAICRMLANFLSADETSYFRGPQLRQTILAGRWASGIL